MYFCTRKPLDFKVLTGIFIAKQTFSNRINKKQRI